MDLRQLGYVVAVYDHGGFTAGARHLHVSQPTLSHGIRTIEAELGVELFWRLGRSVAPTPAGEAVVTAARRVLSEMAGLRAAAAQVSGLVAGRLDIVALPTLAIDPMANLLGAFRARHPAVTVRVTEPDDVEAVAEQISSGRAEVGFTDLVVRPRGLKVVPLYRQEIVAVCPPGTVLDRTSLTASDLADMPLVLTPPGTSTRRLLEAAVATTSRPAQVAVEISQREAILPLVLAGAGSTLLPRALAEQARQRGAVVVPVRPPLVRQVGLLHRLGTLSPAARALVAMATDDAVIRRAAADRA